MNTKTTQGVDTSFRNSRTHIDTGRGHINFSTSNLLDYQIAQAVKDCIENEKINDVAFLQHIEVSGSFRFDIG